MPKLPRPATFPSLLRMGSRGRSPGVSPTRKGSFNGTFAWGNAASGTRAGDACNAGSSCLNLFSSKLFLAAMALLYLLACTALPSISGATQSGGAALRRHRGGESSATSYHAAALTALRNRRMTLERSMPTQNLLTTARDDFDFEEQVTVNYREEGLRVPLLLALNASHWSEYPIYEPASSIPPATPSSDSTSPEALLRSTSKAAAPPSSPLIAANCPQGPIRVFIAITTRCCTPSARAKRDAIRSSWLSTVQQDFTHSITAQFVISQPSGDNTAILDVADFLREEAAVHGDLAVVPGVEAYKQLPAKTLRTLRYALSSPCRYTHIVKTDDDVFLRPEKLLDIIKYAERDWEFDIQSPLVTGDITSNPSTDPEGLDKLTTAVGKTLGFDGHKPVKQNATTPSTLHHLHLFGSSTSSTDDDSTSVLPLPWMEKMYVGKLDSNQTGTFPGWYPNRTSTSKWYLPEADLSDQDCPLGVRWASGWGYMVSRDVAQHAWDTAVEYATAAPENQPPWWGKLPWEDVLMSALLREATPVSHHPGFKAAWDSCDEGTVLKHLDNDAPLLVPGLAAQEASGLWDKKEVVCSSGDFIPGQYDEWRRWRNSLEDNIKGGFM